jgi:MFS family permease
MSSNNPVERNILFFTCIAHAMTHVYIHLFTAIQPEIRRSFEGMSPEDLTSLASISLLVFGAGAIPAGWLSDRYGEKPLLVAFFILSAAGGVMTGFASQTWHLAAGFALIGLGTSIYHPVGLALISKGIRLPARAMGINGLFGSLGTALSPLAALQLTHWTGDWRWAFIGLAIPMVILAVLLGASDTGGKRTRDAVEGEVEGSRGGIKALVGFLLAAMLFGGIYYSLIITMLPQRIGEGAAKAPFLRELVGEGYLPFLIFFIGGIGQVLAGYWMEKREGRGLYILILLGSVPLIYLTGILDGIELLIGASAMAFFMFAVQPVENTLLARYTAPGMRGRIYGLKFILTFGVGMGSGTALSGWIEEGSLAAFFEAPTLFSGLTGVFSAAACFAAASLAMAVLAWVVKRKSGGPQADQGESTQAEAGSNAGLT